MCQETLEASDITAVVEAQEKNIDLLKAALLAGRSLYASEVEKQLKVILTQGPFAIAPALMHAFVTGLQLGQKHPHAYYIGRPTELFDEEEETELTFQSVRNS